MKKIITLILGLLIVNALFAQSGMQPLPINKPAYDLKTQTLRSGSAFGSAGWFNYAAAKNIMTGMDSSRLFGNFLFPDTTILVDYGTQISGPWIHKLAVTFDPSANFFNDTDVLNDASAQGRPIVSKNDQYKVDSIRVVFDYTRNHPNVNIVDTLMLEVAANATIPTYYFGPGALATNLGTDTVFIRGIPYTYTNNLMNISPKELIRSH